VIAIVTLSFSFLVYEPKGVLLNVQVYVIGEGNQVRTIWPGMKPNKVKIILIKRSQLQPAMKATAAGGNIKAT
jgi:hypothetical protein